jgi:acyl-ACP thioesterase
MKDKEILAELKRSYESLQDIIDNTELNNKDLIQVQDILAEKYEEVYESIKATLYYEEGIKIGSSIYVDYENDNSEGLSAGDVGMQWWNDTSFITEF